MITCGIVDRSNPQKMPHTLLVRIKNTQSQPIHVFSAIKNKPNIIENHVINRANQASITHLPMPKTKIKRTKKGIFDNYEPKAPKTQRNTYQQSINRNIVKIELEQEMDQIDCCRYTQCFGSPIKIRMTDSKIYHGNSCSLNRNIKRRKTIFGQPTQALDQQQKDSKHIRKRVRLGGQNPQRFFKHRSSQVSNQNKKQSSNKERFKMILSRKLNLVPQYSVSILQSTESFESRYQRHQKSVYIQVDKNHKSSSSIISKSSNMHQSANVLSQSHPSKKSDKNRCSNHQTQEQLYLKEKNEQEQTKKKYNFSKKKSNGQHKCMRASEINLQQKGFSGDQSNFEQQNIPEKQFPSIHKSKQQKQQTILIEKNSSFHPPKSNQKSKRALDAYNQSQQHYSKHNLQGQKCLSQFSQLNAVSKHNSQKQLNQQKFSDQGFNSEPVCQSRYISEVQHSSKHNLEGHNFSKHTVDDNRFSKRSSASNSFQNKQENC